MPKSKNMNLETISSQVLNKELAYLYGVYLTDGSITRRTVPTPGCTFQLQVIDEDFAETTLSFLKKILPKCKGTVKVYTYDPSSDSFNKKPCTKYCIGVGFTKYGEIFEKETNRKHHLPFSIWNSPDDIKRWFIAGVMDGDGWVSFAPVGNKIPRASIGVGKTEESWIWEFRELLTSMGVHVKKPDISKTYRNKGVEKEYSSPVVRLHMDINSFIKSGLFFTVKRKQDKLNKIIKNGFRD